MSENYHHTQVGKVMVITFAVAFAALIWVGAREGWPAGVVGVLLAVAACVILFTTLTVRIGDGTIEVHFGLGLPRRTIPLDQIARARAVKNSWFTGYGVRWAGSGWLYNVSGRDAVELEFKNGRTFRIGTDEPDELLRALRRAGTGTEG